MEKKQISIIEKFEEKLSFFTNNIIFSLIIIGVIGLSIRILFLDIQIPINSDNYLFFRIVEKILQKHPPGPAHPGKSRGGWGGVI